MAKLIKRSPRRVLVKYRVLDYGDVIQQGDQYLSHVHGKWVDCTTSIGCKAGGDFSMQTNPVRRRINGETD